jgi:LysM repeat protein
MKRILFVIALLICAAGYGQQKLVVKGKGNSRYLEHKVTDRESLSSIGRNYGLSASQLAKFNGRSPSAVLSKGAVLKIPVTGKALLQNGKGTPVYHTIAKGETLSAISKQYGAVPLASLRKWNKLGSGTIKNGDELIVGFIQLTGTVEPVVKETESAAVKPAEPVVNNKVPAESNKEATPKPETRKEAVQVPAAVPVTDSNKPAAKPLYGEHPAYQPQPEDEGYFAALYAQRDQTLSAKYRSGDAATFKTVSGWTDRKYYVLMNDVTPGTIVRITAPNNKSICARVLSALPDTKGSEGLTLRMSNSAASALGMKDGVFTVSVSYFE